ncbi:AAA family ATPase [Pontibacter ramchanderi]|uniref:ATPase family protein associated with various cellular activities (AAA) n=1 Tax=Pontibacter ramchanderi TaxID=1179743 RepID=A0A2N3V102_9BACT|nr:AAA family ATPase [Pontibacter ramchanderi]PKV75266.1 ATPase family protein associated with various cellular activities (AAA) [Pontibacter ramchanderi]
MNTIVNKALGFFQKVPSAPTNPQDVSEFAAFDIKDLYASEDGSENGQLQLGLDEKLRQAYFWITNTAIISPFYDIEYEDGESKRFVFGDSKVEVTLPQGQSYSSFVLIPLLTLAVRGKCLIVGGPGRGKTATSILMGLLAGYSKTDVLRAIQHGQPQMTISDLLGHPLPADMVKAEKTSDIRIAWRKWLGMRVKIIDEYNRIPTRTQSALLTVLSDNYAEIFDQIFECPQAAWYLTANDDAGGGTYQVIEALKDRIDIVIRAFHFNTRFIEDLQKRIELNYKPESMIPEEIIFTEEEMDRIHEQIRGITIAPPLRKRLEFFCRQFEFFESSSDKLEYMTKDTAKLSGLDFRTLFRKETGKDHVKDLGSQTKNGVSVRKIMTLLIYAKALAYFRGNKQVELEDIRQILPFVLHDSLVPHLESPYFDQAGNESYRVDRIVWLRKLFDLSCEEYMSQDMDTEDPVEYFDAQFRQGLENVSKKEVDRRLLEIEKQLHKWSQEKKLYGYRHDDILKLKYFHQRYTNYRRWLQWKK